MLSSDILEQQFGPTDLLIISQNHQYRIIQTISRADKAVLELSLVTFDESSTDVFRSIHDKILEGSSMGKTFREAGVEFIRAVNYINHEVVPPNMTHWFNRSGPATIIDVDILVGPESLHYCHIIEIYNPSVIWPDAGLPKSPTITQTLADFSNLLTPK